MLPYTHHFSSADEHLGRNADEITDAENDDGYANAEGCSGDGATTPSWFVRKSGEVFGAHNQLRIVAGCTEFCPDSGLACSASPF
jgi:hypothetical protein